MNSHQHVPAKTHDGQPDYCYICGVDMCPNCGTAYPAPITHTDTVTCGACAFSLRPLERQPPADLACKIVSRLVDDTDGPFMEFCIGEGEWSNAEAAIRELLQQAMQDYDDALSSPAPGAVETPRCVCEVEDSLVREWVQKAREVAKSKGFSLPPLRSGGSR